VTRFLLAAAMIAALPLAQTPSPPAGNTSPASPTGTADPGAATFSTDRGLLLVAVKPDKVADYEAVIVALQEALSKSEDEEVRTLASGWRVYKSADLDAKANVIFVHFLQPAVAGADYRPSLWLDKLLAGAPGELLAKYRDAFATAPTKLPLTEFANMAVPPAKPANASPDAPAAPAKPTNGSPAAPAKPTNGSPAAPSGARR
jgi:hypothetical protein